ncbi:MAG TPA: class I SAM-dependent methyltransferase [Candidatus Cloacimonetes bacterium]|nr:class I SAM-dependent methyltransferase [Candidatus Cloacimonadota bacterium]HEX38370.1 class I SAM-dependent methyltransferase [Candidatus Cloacimonadota bacterium]
MDNYREFKEIDFDKPSFLFKLSDSLVYLLGGAGFYNKYIDSIPLNGDEQVLDFGSGGGVASKLLAKKLSTGHLTCLEPSKCWIKRLRKRLKKFKNVTLINTYIDQADLQDDTFDIILIHHVLHDIHPDKRADVLKNLSRILKPNGRIYIREPIKKSHGMPYEEIRELFKDIDRDESEFSIKTNKEYSGIYS